mgnify:CR=1 FL=1
MTPLTEHQVFEYESGKTTFIQSCINNWFPKYFIWKVKQRYKRYLGFVTYKNIDREKTARMQDFMKQFKK